MLNNALHSHTISSTASEQLRHTLQSWSFYTTACLAVGISTLLIINTIRFVNESRPSIIAQPFMLPLQVALFMALLFAAIKVTLTITLRRKQGSLQLIIFSPNKVPSLIGGNFLAGLLVYILFVLLTLPSLWLLALETNFVFSRSLMLAIVPTLFVVTAVNAFAIFIAASFPAARIAVPILIVSILAGTLIQLGLQSVNEALLNSTPATPYYDAVVLIRTILASLQTIVSWISPFRMLDIVVNSSLIGDWLSLMQQIGSALAATIFWLRAAARVLHRRGGLL